MTQTGPAVLTGRWSSSDPDDRFVVYDPASGEPLRIVQGGGAAQVDAAVRAADEAQRAWRRRPARERGRALAEVAQVLRGHADELARLETEENGKPLAQSRYTDLEACIGAFEFFGGLAGRLPSSCNDLGPIVSIEFLEPYGVVGGILPFNWPPIHFAAKAAPALAVGNTVVLKPGEQAPLTVLRLAELANQVLPADVLQAVPGTAAAGAALAGHPLVRKLSATGSPETGRRVLRAAAEHLTPTLLELGGKNPLLVFEDADLDLAAAGVIEGAYFNQGEACTAASRVLVHEQVHDALVARLGPAVRRLRVGDGLDPATHVGPLVSARQQRQVLEWLEIARAEGAVVAAQAPLPANARLAGGYFVAPTLLTGVGPGSRVAREEIFGPVTCVIPFSDEADAVRSANSTEFGLVAAVYTTDQARAMRVARQIEAGVVFVNNYNRNLLGTPFGGTRSSGYGREHAVATLHEFGYTKAIRLPSGLGEPLAWPAAAEVLDSGPAAGRSTAVGRPSRPGENGKAAT